jgi:hypothetical protein
VCKAYRWLIAWRKVPKMSQRVRPEMAGASLAGGKTVWEDISGGLEDYEKDKMRRLGIDSIIPQRIKYKKSTR